MKKAVKTKNSLKWAIIPYIIAAIVLAVAGSFFIGNLTNVLQDSFKMHYTVPGGTDDEYLTEPDVFIIEHVSASGNAQFSIPEPYYWRKPWQKSFYAFISNMQILLIPLWCLLCLPIPGIIFYKKKIKKPLDILMNASQQIGEENLDFKIGYKSGDEFGLLCISFEKMRAQLEKNHLEMWRQMDDRKKLNAAFAHDLRTPLTILKGQSEMLLDYIPKGQLSQEKILNILSMMQNHITRLEAYTEMMNKLQRLEDVEIVQRPEADTELKSSMLQAGQMLGTKCRVNLNFSEKGRTLDLDVHVVMEVYENLLSNALRYCKNTVTVDVSFTDRLIIVVSDDGPGFSEKALTEAARPFYSSEKNTGHFGIGLTLCRLFCEKHGGYLSFYNQEHGGASVKAVF